MWVKRLFQIKFTMQLKCVLGRPRVIFSFASETRAEMARARADYGHGQNTDMPLRRASNGPCPYGEPSNGPCESECMRVSVNVDTGIRNRLTRRCDQMIRCTHYVQDFTLKLWFYALKSSAQRRLAEVKSENFPGLRPDRGVPSLTYNSHVRSLSV